MCSIDKSKSNFFYMNFSIFLFLIGILGFVLNRKKYNTNANFNWNNVIIYNIFNIN